MGEDLSLRDQLAALGVTSETLAALDVATRNVVSAMIERTTYRIGVATAGTDHQHGYGRGLSEILAGVWHHAPTETVLRTMPAAPLPDDVDAVARLLVVAGAPVIERGTGPGWRMKLAPDGDIRENDITGVRGIRQEASTITPPTVDTSDDDLSGIDDDEEDDERDCSCINCDERGCDGDCDLCDDGNCDQCHSRHVEGGDVDSCCGRCSYCDRCHNCRASGQHDDNVYTNRDGDRYCTECEHHCEPCNDRHDF